MNSRLIFRIWPPAAREAALTVRPASASGEPTTPAPDYPFKIEFTGWSRVEAILDFGAQPGELLAALLLMQDRGDDGGFAAGIPALAYLRSYECLECGRESYGDYWRHHRSIEDTHEPANPLTTFFDGVSQLTSYNSTSLTARV